MQPRPRHTLTRLNVEAAVLAQAIQRKSVLIDVLERAGHADAAFVARNWLGRYHERYSAVSKLIDALGREQLTQYGDRVRGQVAVIAANPVPRPAAESGFGQLSIAEHFALMQDAEIAFGPRPSACSPDGETEAA